MYEPCESISLVYTINKMKSHPKINCNKCLRKYSSKALENVVYIMRRNILRIVNLNLRKNSHEKKTNKMKPRGVSIAYVSTESVQAHFNEKPPSCQIRNLAFDHINYNNGIFLLVFLPCFKS